MVTLALVLATVVFLVLHANLVEWTPVKMAGAALAVFSVAMLAVARLQLGASFAIKAKAKTLVTTGIYSKIRNPIYVFGWLFLFGMATVLENWLLLGISVVLIPVQLYRARKEEAVLSAAFGEEYARYKAGTWF
jgi:protein-S-isoprenylcysteine O-methyltransferase Ste14